AAELRLSDHTAVPQRFIAANAYPTAPGPCADDGPELELLETQGQGFAIAAALAVDQRRQVTTEGVGGHGIHVAVARAANRQDLPVQVRQDHGGDGTPMIPAIVNNQAMSAPLGGIIPGEFPQAAITHVIKVNVANGSLALLIHILSGFTHPVG